MQYLTYQALLAIFCLFFTSCAALQYKAKPIDTQKTIAKILEKDSNSDAFHAYLIGQGYAATDLPLSDWDLDALMQCALFHNTKFAIAKAQLGLTKTAIDAAGIKQPPIINANIARSNRANDDIRPWAYGFTLDIPITTNNKRALKIEEAQKLAEAKRLDIAETAWQLRNQIAINLTDFYQNLAETKLLEEAALQQANIAKMLQKRMDAGIVPSALLNKANLSLLKTKHQLASKQGELTLINTRLAKNIGLSVEKLKVMRIKPLSLDARLALQAKKLAAPLASKTLQEDALLNRIDIRRSLAKYAAAELKIKLEVAKQIPDINLSPSFLFEFGDKIWSLGFSNLLNSLNHHAIAIDKAKQLRQIEGLQFNHLQASIIGNINQAQASYRVAKKKVAQDAAELAAQTKQAQAKQRQFDAGLIGRLDLSQHTLNIINAKQQLIASKFKLLKIGIQIENILQKPLYNDFATP